MVSREERLKAVLNSNKPFYKQHDLKPQEAGRSRMHDANGTPNFRPFENKPREDVRESQDRVIIQGESPNVPAPARPLNKRELNPRRSAVEPPIHQDIGEDLPVHVGAHEEHAWYDEKVAGRNAERATSARQYIDNNYIDTEALQGADPLIDPPVEQLLPKPKDPRKEPEPEPELKEKEPFFGSGVYTVFVDGSFVYSNNDKNVILRCVEDVMLNHKVTLDRITVIKKLDVKFGVILD